MKKLVVCFALVGCVHIPAPDYDIVPPPGHTELDKKRDWYECKSQARYILPGTYVPVPNFGGGFVGGFAQGRASAQAQSRVGYDVELIKECLGARGYQFVTVDQANPETPTGPRPSSLR